MNEALTDHKVFADQAIYKALATTEEQRDLDRIERGESVIDRVRMPEFREKASKIAVRALKWGYWGAVGYGQMTGTGPLGVIEDVTKIPGKIKDLFNIPISAVKNVFDSGGGAAVSGAAVQVKPNLNEGALFDIPSTKVTAATSRGMVTKDFQGGFVYDTIKKIAGIFPGDSENVAKKVTKAIGTPFVGLYSGFSKHTDYPLKGTYGPFVFWPLSYIVLSKLGVWKKLDSAVSKAFAVDEVTKLRREEEGKLRERAREALLSGDRKTYTDILLAVENLPKRYDSLRRVHKEHTNNLSPTA